MTATKIDTDQLRAQTLTPTSVSTNPATKPKLGLLSRFGLLTAVVLSLLAIGGTASAWQSSSTSGRVGPVTVFGSVYTGGAHFKVGNLAVYRNGAVPAGTPQQAATIVELQFWSNNRWVIVDSNSQTLILPMGNSPAITEPWTMFPHLNGGRDQTGYYRVVYYVGWGTGYSVASTGLTTGTEVIIPSATSDIRCGVSTCRAYANYTQVW